MSRFRARIDVPLIATHLSTEDATSVSEDYVIAWLEAAGFVRDGEWWLVNEADLGQLDPSEVLEVEPADDSPPPIK